MCKCVLIGYFDVEQALLGGHSGQVSSAQPYSAALVLLELRQCLTTGFSVCLRKVVLALWDKAFQ